VAEKRKGETRRFEDFARDDGEHLDARSSVVVETRSASEGGPYKSLFRTAASQEMQLTMRGDGVQPFETQGKQCWTRYEEKKKRDTLDSGA